MNFVVIIEGVEVEAKSILKRQLRLTWKKVSNQTFPKIKAFQLRDKDFDRIIQLRRCKEDELREIEEWNRILTTEGTDACVFNTDESEEVEYIILIRDNPYHCIEEILVHELTHIARGDL